MLPLIILAVLILAVVAYFLLRDNKEINDGTVTPVYDSTVRTGADSLPQ
jgi:hypothetical protein